MFPFTSQAEITTKCQGKKREKKGNPIIGFVIRLNHFLYIKLAVRGHTPFRSVNTNKSRAQRANARGIIKHGDL
jgi:hypothetical protein